MKRFTCNYAVARFMPYPETEEFVCVGVALLCQETGYFGYKLEMKRRDRVSGFFPELDVRVFTNGRRIFEQQLQHVNRLLTAAKAPGQMKFDWESADPVGLFKELVRPRESLFHFGDIATVMADEPAHALDRLYADYVHRQFAQRDEYQEQVMTRRLVQTFKEQRIEGYKPALLGDEVYKFRLPLVRGASSDMAALRIIKPLNLAQAETTDIIDHGDLWARRFRRLLNLNVAPPHVLLPVKVAPEAKRADIAHDLCGEFRKMGITTLEFGQREDIVAFAKAG
ncbi:MAG TPA: DUF3037 domain-containing protein [Kiritimatiellia bacterium]|nr:DUF3037 domain-containing protein [Kiritimatiellia bacterium]